MTTPSELADQLEAEAADLEREIAEIDLLVGQATTEATRHQARRDAASDKLSKLGDSATPKEAVELATQLVTLTRRSALMDAQLEILEGKKRSSARLQETLRRDAEQVRALGETPGGLTRAAVSAAGAGSSSPTDSLDAGGPGAPAVSRLVLAAQEDLRREIARAMHDGPAQSLTNIVLQAEIVERLVKRDPTLAAAEVHELVAMVQQTLEATKTFIFDVRPMVLDDLGLVPTLRRAARDRGKRAGVPVEFESVGVDRRLDPEMESGLFRLADDALAGYLSGQPDRVSVGMDWGETLVLTIHAERDENPVPVVNVSDGAEELPPAIAAMVAERRAEHHAAVAAARDAAIMRLPEQLLGDLRQRTETLGMAMTVLEAEGTLQLSVNAPSTEADATSEEAPSA